MTRENDTFEFRPFEINSLDITKKTSRGLPSHILKLTSDLSFSAISKLANDMAQQCTFPD